MKKAIIAMLSLLTLVVLVASQAFPGPYGENDNRTVIVIGSNQDRAAAQDIRNALMGNGNGNFTNDTEAYLFQRAGNRINLGEQLADFQIGPITENDLPMLLQRGEYHTFRGETYDYDQELNMAENLEFTVFRDRDFRDRDPTPGIFIRNRQPIMNYTLNFRNFPVSTIQNNRLVDFEHTELEILGREYTIVSATPNTFELLTGPTRAMLELGETETYVVNETTYEVEVLFVDRTSARFMINNETTRSLAEGATYRMRDGTVIAVTRVDYQDFAGGIQRVEFFIGASRLTVTDGQEVRSEGTRIEGLTAFIDGQIVNGEEYELREIVFVWTARDNIFVAERTTFANQTRVPIIFQNISLQMRELVIPAQEELLVETQRNNIVLNVLVEGADNQFELPILYTDGETFTAIGEDEDRRLLTSAGNQVVWNDTIHEYLVVSWESRTFARSYILRLDIGTDRDQPVVNFFNHVTGREERSNVRENGTARFGDVILTVESINAAEGTAVISVNNGVSFNRLFTQEGLMINLPTEDGENGTVNLGTDTEWRLVLTEEDVNNNIGEGQSFSIIIEVNQNRNEIDVRTVEDATEVMAGGILASPGNDTDLLVGWVQSPLATRVEIDTTAGRSFARIIYHGSEVFAQIYLVSGERFMDGVTEIPIIEANEIQDYTDRNMIVVGGACVNNVTATLLNVSFPLCGQNWTDETGVGEGEFMVRTFTSPFNNQRVATIVAGYEREDTLNASEYLIEQRPTIRAGEEHIGGR
jgi:hypothetical protein